MRGSIFAMALPASGIDCFAPAYRDQPRLGVIGNTARRPFGKRGGEGVGQRVLGRRHVAQTMRQEGDELAVAAPGRRFRGPASLAVTLPRHRVRPGYIAQIGRTSIVP